MVGAVHEAPGLLDRAPRAPPAGAGAGLAATEARGRRRGASPAVPGRDPGARIGEGSDAATLYAACRLVRGFALTEAEASTLVWEWAGGRDGWTREWVEQKVANALEYGDEEIGGLR